MNLYFQGPTSIIVLVLENFQEMMDHLFMVELSHYEIMFKLSVISFNEVLLLFYENRLIILLV